MYDEAILMSVLSTLPAMFAALLWLKAGRHEALRNAMVLLPAGALFYLLAVYTEDGMLRYLLHHHVSASVALLVLLLGRYMLKCDWTQSLYAAGVYQLCSALSQVVVVPLFTGRFVEKLNFSLSIAVAVLFIWLFVWLCARKSGITRREGFLTAASIEACYTLLFANLAQYTALLLHIGSPEESMALMVICYGMIYIVCHMLCFSLVMRLVHRQSWLRSVAYALLLVLAYAFAGGTLGALKWLLR